MKVVVQRVTEASVTVDGRVTGQINKGFLVLLGLHVNDTHELSDFIIQKMIKLRVFEDEEEKLNKSIQDVNGDFLIVSQFTLYGDCSKGNRPSFIKAMRPEFSEQFYNEFVEKLEVAFGKKVQTGQFGAMMDVALHNDGPTTIIIEKNNP